MVLPHLAEPEDWAGSSADGRHLPILDSYLRYTYQRLVIEQKIAVAADGQYAALNTGLLTPYAEAIFGLFQRNRREDLQPWFFLRWASESDRDTLRHFPLPPDLAEYVSDPADLVYDWRRRLMPAYDHILADNIDRFPADLSTHLCVQSKLLTPQSSGRSRGRVETTKSSCRNGVRSSARLVRSFSCRSILPGNPAPT
jgi:hypothetical protein